MSAARAARDPGRGSGAIKICRANATVKQVMEVSGFNGLL